MIEELSNFERLCLEYIADKNPNWKDELHQLIDVLKVIDRAYENPVGIYVDFSIENDRKDLPELLSADIELPEFNDCISFLFYPNTKNETGIIFLEVVSVAICLDFDYISSKLKLELGK